MRHRELLKLVQPESDEEHERNKQLIACLVDGIMSQLGVTDYEIVDSGYTVRLPSMGIALLLQVSSSSMTGRINVLPHAGNGKVWERLEAFDLADPAAIDIMVSQLRPRIIVGSANTAVLRFMKKSHGL